MKVLKITITLIALLLSIRLCYVVVTGTGMLEDYKPLLAEQCQQIPFAAGPEDITIDHTRRQVFVSADDRRIDDNRTQNGIYVFSLDNPTLPRLVSVDAPQDFHPHGIFLARTTERTKTICNISQTNRRACH